MRSWANNFMISNHWHNSLPTTPTFPHAQHGKKALESVKKTLAIQANHPIDALEPIVANFMTLGESTSGVEQGFSKALRAISPQQLSATPELEADLCKIIIQCGNVAPEHEVIKGAVKLWLRHLATARKGAACRVDKGMPWLGLKRKARDEAKISDMTEATWLRKRHHAVTTAASASASVSQADNFYHSGVAMGSSDWLPKSRQRDSLSKRETGEDLV